MTFHSHRSAGISEVRWVHLARQYIALPRPCLPLWMESSVSRDLRSHVPQMWGLSGFFSLVYVQVPGLSGGGGIVCGKEGVGAVYYQVASWCMVVGGGDGVVYVVREDHVLGGGWLLVVGDGNVSLDMVPEVAQGGHPVDPCILSRLLGVAGAWAWWGMGHVGLLVAATALGVHPPRHGVSDKVSPPFHGEHPDLAPRGGRALAVRGGEQRAVVSGDVEEFVKKEVLDALPQGGRLEQGGRRDGLGGTEGVEA